MERIIGIDFDNTIVRYDHLIHDEATRRGLVHQGVPQIKKAVRDYIRRLSDGENEWQKVQACVYGPRMVEAELIEGVRPFFEKCRQGQIRTFIISHKTEFANFDETGINLRKAALSWMDQHGFFDRACFGLSQKHVHFGATRQEKIQHIKRLGCTHFIDDLEEMFLEALFPDHVVKILYIPHLQHSSLPGVKIAASWKEIHHYFFGDV